MILTKLEPPHLELPNSRYRFYKIASKLELIELAFYLVSLTIGTHRSAGPAYKRMKNRGGNCDGAAAVKLADGDFTGDEEGTSVTTSTSRID